MGTEKTKLKDTKPEEPFDSEATYLAVKDGAKIELVTVGPAVGFRISAELWDSDTKLESWNHQKLTAPKAPTRALKATDGSQTLFVWVEYTSQKNHATVTLTTTIAGCRTPTKKLSFKGMRKGESIDTGRVMIGMRQVKKAPK